MFITTDDDIDNYNDNDSHNDNDDDYLILDKSR